MDGLVHLLLGFLSLIQVDEPDEISGQGGDRLLVVPSSISLILVLKLVLRGMILKGRRETRSLVPVEDKGFLF